MKFLNFKKSGIPSLQAIRPAIFDVESHWFFALGLFAAIFIITTAVGLKLFYYGYSEGYKKETSPEEFQNLIDVNKLKVAIEKRNELMTEEAILPEDPSI